VKKFKILGMSTIEKEKKLEQLEAELVQLQFKHRNRQLDKVMKLREVKRDIVRLKTFIHQEKSQEA